ncbi:MAG: hypothetical protein C0514_02045 [Candidatus Puniceispirillum sp.]|nr:hypothetical protein [Candidatus Puniceispirillum sp.]
MKQIVKVIMCVALVSKGFASFACWGDVDDLDAVHAPHAFQDEKINVHLAYLTQRYPEAGNVLRGHPRTFCTVLCEAVMALSPLTSYDAHAQHVERLEILAAKHTLMDAVTKAEDILPMLRLLMEVPLGDYTRLFYSKNSFKKYVLVRGGGPFLAGTMHGEVVLPGKGGYSFALRFLDVPFDPQDDAPFFSTL